MHLGASSFTGNSWSAERISCRSADADNTRRHLRHTQALDPHSGFCLIFDCSWCRRIYPRWAIFPVGRCWYRVPDILLKVSDWFEMRYLTQNTFSYRPFRFPLISWYAEIPHIACLISVWWILSWIAFSWIVTKRWNGMPISRFQIPDSRFQIPGSRFQIPDF